MLNANGTPDPRLDEAVDRFEDAWQRGDKPAIDDHLAADAGDRRALLVELVHVDLEYRLKAGEPVRVETYLRRYPELSQDRGAVLELLAAERRLRQRGDPALTVAEYVGRFPAFRDELLASAAAPVPTVTIHYRSSPSDEEDAAGTEPGDDLATRSRYHVLGLLARGGLGEILTARDEDLHREVALKRLQRRQARNAESRGRFLREAEITSQLEHPGVVPVYGLGQAADGSPVYAMRLIRGETFQEATRRFHEADKPGRDPAERSLGFRQLLGRFLSVCNTVAYAHSRGVLHRDLKPDNILLGSYGETLVVDWGLAKTAGGDVCHGRLAARAMAGATAPPTPAGSDLTQDGEVFGTPAFMSPEQASGRGDAVGAASDIYSLGATLYVLLTGRAPFAQGQVYDVLEKVRRADFPRPRQVKKEVDPALEAVCLKAMAQRPEGRYEKVLALAADVEQWLAGERVSAWPEPVTVGVRRWVSRHPTLVTTAAVGLAAGAVLAVVTTLWFAAADREHSAADREHSAKELAEMRKTQLERADQERYFFHIADADREWWAGRFPSVERQLAECKRELRGWEWNYLGRRNRDVESLLTLRGHDKEVWNVVFSPDGARLASASLDGTVRVWDAETGRPIHNLEGHAGPVWGLAFSPDGKLLASGGGDRTVRLWDADAGRPLRSFTDLPGEVKGVAFGVKGTVLAAAIDAGRDARGNPLGLGGEVLLWDAVGWKPRDPLPCPTAGLTSVAFRPDGKVLAAGTVDGKVRRWEVDGGTERDALDGPLDAVEATAFSPDGRWLAAASNDGTVGVWDGETGKVKHVLYGHARPAWGVAFSPDSLRLASSGDDYTIKIWDVALGRLVRTLHGHVGGIANVAFSPDGKRVASASDDQTVKVWDPEAPRAMLTLCGHTDRVSALAFSPDGRRVASAGGAGPADDAAVRVWDAADGRELRALRVTGGSAGVAFSRGGKWLAAAGADKSIHVWDVAGDWKETVLRGHDGEVSAVAFSPDGGLLASASKDQTVKLWDAATWKELRTLKGHDGEVWSVAFSPDGKRLASGGADKVVKVWDAATGKEEMSLGGHAAGVRAVAFSPDGKRLAAGVAAVKRVLTLEAGEVTLWDLETGQIALSLRGHLMDVCAVAFSPDGGRLVSAGEDRRLKLWEPVTGREILTLYDGHLKSINAVAFSPDGARLASAGSDGVVILWNGTAPE